MLEFFWITRRPVIRHATENAWSAPLFNQPWQTPARKGDGGQRNRAT